MISFEKAVGNAARLLQHAEMETDLAKMARYESLADSWASLASLIAHMHEYSDDDD